MRDIELLRIEFTKEDLGCIPEEEAVFLLQLGGLIHEVISLQKFIHMSSRGVENDLERMAENAQSLYFYRLLAGTLFEGWALLTLNRYRATIVKYKPKLSALASSEFKKLEQYFTEKNNLCETIRNNFAYHYNFGKIRNMLRSWPEDDKFEIYFSEYHANCRYTASDIITNFAMLGTTDSTVIEQKLKNLISEVPDTARSFVEVISEYLSLILKKIVRDRKIQGDDVIIPDVPSLDDLRLHYFVAPQ